MIETPTQIDKGQVGRTKPEHLDEIIEYENISTKQSLVISIIIVNN